MFTEEKTGYEEFVAILKNNDDIKSLNIDGLELKNIDLSKKKIYRL